MGLFERLDSALSRLFSSLHSQAGSSQARLPVAPAPPILFPQFARLPVELRLKIWRFALESRVLRVHLHIHNPMWVTGEQRYQGYAPDHPEHSSLSEPFDGLNFVPETEEEGGSVYGGGPYDNPARRRPYHLGISKCRPHSLVTTPPTESYLCGCGHHPHQPFNSLIPPAVLFVCHESRDATKSSYSIYLDDEYDTRGLPVTNPISRVVKYLSIKHPLAGILLNPSIDAILVRANIASRMGVQRVHHFAAVLAKQVSDIRKVIVELQIAMIPMRFWSSERFQYWKNWGETGWWVPTRFLIKMRGLREVVFVWNPKGKLLPLAWRTRTESQWIEEFLKVEERWPAEWEGRMPSLRFVESKTEAAHIDY